MLVHAKPDRHLRHLVTALGDLLDSFGLEFFGKTLLTHGNSNWASGLRLRGVKKTRGDSSRVGNAVLNCLSYTLLESHQWSPSEMLSQRRYVCR